jgi:pimeloyl-ACP methyl ester carboxylesterase
MGGGSLKGGLSSYLGACSAALGATRAFYTSQESVEDLDALRQALGGTPLSLFAVSYGGRVAGMYAREHPQGVARMVLDSPSPLTGSDPLSR